MSEGRQALKGLFATKLPMVAAFGLVLTVVAIIGSFFVSGASALTWEFLSQSPENANTEGGIYPAIIGTVYLVLLMTLAAVPIGTITAIYLTEYAKQRSFFARSIRFAVNTLAGVPSVVFGLFGLGFFVITIGGGIDRANWESRVDNFVETVSRADAPMHEGRPAAISAVQNYLEQVPDDDWSAEIDRFANYPGGTSTVVTREQATEFIRSNPDLVWGQPSLIWAALTLALLTLPVVIVSVEESLRAVPRDIREASVALGATRLETIRKVVVPNSLTGILTGSILAIGRGAGEVAPILFTGVVYSAQTGPESLHDQFMHLGYHLYILSTQSPDVEATMPLQYATTIVLLGLTLALNLTGILLRSRLRKRRLA